MPQTVFASLGRGVGLGWGSRGCVGVGPAVALVMTQRPQFVSRSQLSRRGVMAIGNWARAWSIQTVQAARRTVKAHPIKLLSEITLWQ